MTIARDPGIEQDERLADARLAGGEEDLDRSLRPKRLDDFINQAQVTAQLEVFIEAIGKADRRTTHLYFDVSGVAGLGQWVEKAPLIASRIRQLGVGRVLYGSDGSADLLRPREAWSAFRQLPLSDVEFRTIETNQAPYMR